MKNLKVSIINIIIQINKIIEQIPILYKNYETRVKEFITEMTNPLNQIVLTDRTEKIDNARTEMIKENSLKKPFIFKGYTTELDRINEAEKNNKLLYNLPDYPDRNSIKARKISPPQKINFHPELPPKKLLQNTNNFLANSVDKIKLNGCRRISIREKNQINDLIKKKAILQPQMRFRARTDLERVYDSLNGKYIEEPERDIIERQLKNIDLFDYKKPKELLKEEIKNKKKSPSEKIINKSANVGQTQKSFEEINDIKSVYGPSNIYFEPSNNDKKSWSRKNNLNKEARNFLNIYHQKTHFKATKEIAAYKAKNKIKDTCFLLPHLFPQNRSHNLDIIDNNKRFNTIGNTKLNYNKKIINYSNENDLFKFADEHEKDELKEEQNLDYDYQSKINNPILKNEIKFDSKSIELVTKMAFLKKENDGDESNDNILVNKKIEDEKEKCVSNMDQENNMNMIANKILNECNVVSQKSRYNDISHKINAGKTMITKGLSIEEFLNKNKLKY